MTVAQPVGVLPVASEPAISVYVEPPPPTLSVSEFETFSLLQMPAGLSITEVEIFMLLGPASASASRPAGRPFVGARVGL